MRWSGDGSMTEPTNEGQTSVGQSAGALLREARQARGMHIAALAAAIKVSPRKLEALEADRHEELVDATFTRALAQAVCRALKIDAEPVLAKLPQTAEKGLQMSPGLNAPLRQRTVRRDSGERPALSRPVVWGSAALLAAALAVYFLPPGLFGTYFETAPAPAASAASSALVVQPLPAPAAAPASPVMATSGAAATAAVPVSAGTAAASQPPAAAPATAAGADLVVRATEASWVEVHDANGRVLISRTVEAGESVLLAGPAPLRVKIGNAAATQVSFRGQPVPLVARTGNVARIELK
ncbi:MAG: helix-turn-helix domain-containing protein [Pseudomonadota bacterium]